MWNIIKIILQYLYCRYIQLMPFVVNDDGNTMDKDGNVNSINKDKVNNNFKTISKQKQRRCVKTVAAPGLMTLLDTALYRAHEGQLTATVSSANATLIALIQFKSHAKSLLNFCYTELSPISLTDLGSSDGISTPSSSSSPSSPSNSTPSLSTPSSSKVQLIQRRKKHLESLSILASFASYCIECANDAIERLVTDKLSKSANYEPMSQNDYQKENANLTMNMNSMNVNMNDHSNGNGPVVHSNGVGTTASIGSTPPLSPTQPLSSPLAATPSSSSTPTTTPTKMSMASTPQSSSQQHVSFPAATTPTTPTMNAANARDAKSKRLFVEEGIISSKYNHWNEVGLRLRYLHHQQKNSSASTSSSFSSSTSSSTCTTLRKKDCWESESLFCPDYVWAEDSMLQCQRMVRSIMKHDAVEVLIDLLEHYYSSSSDNINSSGIRSNLLSSNNSTGIGDNMTGSAAATSGGSSGGGHASSPTSNSNSFAGLHGNNAGSNSNNLSSSEFANGHGIHSFLPLLFDHENSNINNSHHRHRLHQNAKLRNKLLVLLSNIMTLLKHDLPLRIHQFRCGIESDVNVTKRLYLLKNECRAPFRAFLEGHANVQRAPDLELVDSYIKLHNKNTTSTSGEEDINNTNSNNTSNQPTSLKEKKKIAERKIQDCIGNIRFQEALMTEYKCETLEVEMGMVLLPFCNLARTLLDGKGAFHLMEVPGVLPAGEVLPLQELLRRLKFILCKKPDVYASTGIRPLLQDLQGIPRDSSLLSTEIFVFGQFKLNSRSSRISTEEAMEKRLDKFCSQLQYIYDIAKTKGGFGVDKKEFNGLTTAIRACTNAGLDTNKFRNMFKEWYSLCRQQHALSNGKSHDQGQEQTEKEGKDKEEEKGTSSKDDDDDDDDNDDGTNDKSLKTTSTPTKQQTFAELAEEMRKAEIEVSIAMAPKQALSVVQQRIDQIEKDRNRRFEILQEMLDEICLREMDFHLELNIPKKDVLLELPPINSVSGIFDPVLEMTGEM